MGAPGRHDDAPMTPERWLTERSFGGEEADPDRLLAAKRDQGATVSVVLPALNVAATIEEIVVRIRERWVDGVPLVDEIVVIDGPSTDDTAAVAHFAGARVESQELILPWIPGVPGKGDAMWRSLAVTTGDIVVWLDSDVHDFDARFVPGLLAPLLEVPEVAYVKAAYRRAYGDAPSGGGRVTEICARPLLNLFLPELAVFAQPLSGEAAGRRSLLSALPFTCGYDVEIALLIDVWRAVGLAGMGQVDLGVRRHDHQSTEALGRMAHVITRAVLSRVGAPTEWSRSDRYAVPGRDAQGAPVMLADALRRHEHPPMDSVARGG